jgi:hypothetical protein
VGGSGSEESVVDSDEEHGVVESGVGNAVAVGLGDAFDQAVQAQPTQVVVQSVAVFNDFVNPLYFLPGEENATVQLTLFNFQSQLSTKYNLLFMNILLITIPPLIMFLFFNRQIVAGMTAGAVKG